MREHVVSKLLSRQYHAVRHMLFKRSRQFKLLKLLRHFGILTCNDYISLNSTNARQIIQSVTPTATVSIEVETDRLLPGRCLGNRILEGMNGFSPQTEKILLNISDRRFSLRSNHLLDPQMNALGEKGTPFESLPFLYKRFFPSQPHLFCKTVAYLSNPDPGNYYHWLCRTLPLIKLYQDHFQFDQIDYFYVGQFKVAPFHRESLTRADISLDKLVQEDCSADRIYAAINSRDKQFGDPINRQAFLYTRQLFYKSLDAATKRTRIYVSRGQANRRRVLNESEVLHTLAKHGFQSVSMDGLTIQAQADLFAQAEFIVAPHGAALTNLLFATPGTRVIEMIPFGYINHCFYVLANYAGAEYFYLEGKETDSLEKQDPRHLDIEVDIEVLEQSIMKFDNSSHVIEVKVSTLELSLNRDQNQGVSQQDQDADPYRVHHDTE